MKDELRRNGITLIEMLVVIAIVGLLLGVGIALFIKVNKGYRLRGAVSQVESVIRFARNYAISERGTAYVEIDAKKNQIFAVGQKTAGLWHFEDNNGGETTGAFGLNGMIKDANLADGKFGKGLAISEEGYVDCGKSETFNPIRGIAVEAWIFPSKPEKEREQIILQKGETYYLKLKEDNALEVGFGVISIDTGSFVIPFFKWSLVGFRYDGNVLEVYVNKVLRAKAKKIDKPKLSGASFMISSKELPFYGYIDEVKVSQIAAGEKYTLPENVKFKDPIRRIYFDSQGKLDAIYHKATVSLILVSEQGEARKITIGFLGSTSHESIGKKMPRE